MRHRFLPRHFGIQYHLRLDNKIAAITAPCALNCKDVHLQVQKNCAESCSRSEQPKKDYSTLLTIREQAADTAPCALKIELLRVLSSSSTHIRMQSINFICRSATCTKLPKEPSKPLHNISNYKCPETRMRTVSRNKSTRL